MPAYQVTGPDGRKYRVDAPEGATSDEAVEYVYETYYSGKEKAKPERTVGGYAKEALKGLVPGLVGLGETAVTGAAALLPEEAERAVRKPVEEFAAGVREKFAPAPGYEDTTVRKLSEAVGSTLPFLPLGVLGAAGRVAATGLGVATGAGEARQRAEQEGTTEGERGVATVLGTVPGAAEAFAPLRILRRFGFGDDAVKEVAGFLPALRRVAQAGGEEALQEASSQVLQNLIAKGVYKPEEAAFGGVGEAAQLGGGAGAIVGAIAELALGRRLRGAQPPPERREEEAPPETPAVTPPVAEAAPPAEEEPAEEPRTREDIERLARELRFSAMQDDRLREAIERQERDEASKDDLEYLAQYEAELLARQQAGEPDVRASYEGVGPEGVGGGAELPVPPSGAATPPASEVGERAVADVGAPSARSDVGEEAGEPALTKTADELIGEIASLKTQAVSLLTKNGRVPAYGSKKRQEYDALKQQEETLKQQWNEQSKAEERAQRQAARFDERFAREEAQRQADLVAEPEIKFQRPYNPQIETPQFKNWFGDSKAVDQEGKPLVLYRGAIGGTNVAEGALEGKPREGYATFASTSPEVAASYGQPDFAFEESGAITPLYIKANKLIEFPVQTNQYGVRRFDKFEFDRQAQNLRPGEVLVARQVIDYGPRASVETDPERLYSYPSDIYAWGQGTKIKSAVGNIGAFGPEESIVSQRGEVGAGLPTERVQATASEAIRGWTNPPNVVVASSVEDPVIPENYRKRIPADAPGFYVDGTTYVLADRAKDESGVRGTVFHESLGHYGLQQEFQGGLQDVMQGIYDTNPKMRAEADARIKKFGISAPTAVEEVFAERSEAGPIKEAWLRNAFNRVAAYIRNFLRQRGFVSKYSDNDVDQILRQAHRRVTQLKKTEYDPFDPDVRYQRSPEEQRKGDRAFINSIGKIPTGFPAATKETYELAANAASKLPSATRKALYSLYDPHELDRMYGKKIKSTALAKIWKDANLEGVTLRKLQEEIMENTTRWRKVMDAYSPAEQERIFNLFMDTTVTKLKRQYVDAKGKVREREEFGVEVLSVNDPSRNINWVADAHPLTEQFNKLDAPVKQVYKELRLAYTDYSLAVEKILQQYLTPNEWQKILNKLNERRIRVYLPLFRTGKYKLKYTDAENNSVSLQFENPRQRDLAEKEIVREGGKILDKSEVGAKGEKQLPPTGLFADIIATLQEKKVSPEIQSLVFEHYLDYLPANSVLQRGRRREGTAGYIKNPLYVYANVADSYARRIVTMEFTPKYLAHQEEFVTDLKSAADRGDIENDVANDLEAAVESYMDYNRNPNLNNWAAKVGYFSYQMYLGTNISTALVQGIDTPTIMLSRLLGKGHSLGKVANSLLKGSSVFFSKNKSPEMQELLRRGLNSGAIREQKLQDIAEFKNLDSRWAKLKSNVDRITNWAFAKSDMFNREVGLIAAYDLQKTKNGTPPDQFDEKAFEEAEKAVYDVYGSSFPKAAPAIMGNGLAKTALTFKRFGIKRMHLLYNAYKEATKDLDPNDPDSKVIRDAARKEIIGYFSTAFLSAGVQGMPLVGFGMGLVTVLNAALGDDDEPYNPDFALREAVGLFAYKGPINYLLGVDIASRTGWTGMFWREDPKRMAEVGPVTYVVEQALGPAYSYAVGVPKAIDYFQDEKYMRGFEQLAPRAAGNILKGMRYGTEGAKTASGMPLVEDVNAYNVFMQIFGFRPSEVAEAGDIAGASKRMESQIRERRNAIIARAAVARISGDMEGFREAVEEARAFSRKYPGRMITTDTLIGAVERRQKKIAMSVNGVTLDPKLARGIYEELGVTEEVD